MLAEGMLAEKKLAAEKAGVVLPEVSRENVERTLERMSGARRHSDAIFNLLRPGSLYERPIPERHRIVFYLGHLEAFDWNLLNDAVLGLKSVHPEFDRLFAFGIDPVGGGLPTDLPSDWPSEEAVRKYVSGVRSAIDKNLAERLAKTSSYPSPKGDGFPLRTLLNVAIEHRLMHAETLAYMLHQLPFDMKVAEHGAPSPVGPPVVHRGIAIPTGGVTLGLDQNSGIFGWDNEYEAHTEEVPAFEIDGYKVTNRQYLEFLTAGGYETRAFWDDDDWDWKNTEGVSHPLFWSRDGSQWRWRGMFSEMSLSETPSGEEPVALDWPVYVSHAEASAYARWAGKSLPTEVEWQRAAFGTAGGDTRLYPLGSETPDAKSDSKFGNFDFRRWDPVPVNAFPDGQSSFSVHDMLGNGWEWTSTVFGPFPGFQPFPFYPGYSAGFFDGKHFVMKGGSARTAACMLRPTFRNWFQAHYQYVYAGFRCVRR